MKTTLCAAVAGLVLWTGCGGQNSGTAEGESSNPLSAPADYLGAVNQAHKSAIRQTDLASLKQAISLFQVQEERNPTNLTELVTKGYVPALPETSGTSSLQYDPRTGEVNIKR